jgi:hypothetical protein
MAGTMICGSLIARAAAGLLPGFVGVIGGKVRMAGPVLCPTGH